MYKFPACISRMQCEILYVRSTIQAYWAIAYLFCGEHFVLLIVILLSVVNILILETLQAAQGSV